MAFENPSASPGAEGASAGHSRRRMLSIIPAALFAGWRGLGKRPKKDPGPAIGAIWSSQRPAEETADSYSYECDWGSEEDCFEEICCTVTTFEYGTGRLIDHRILPPKSLSSKSAPGGAPAQG